MRNLTLRKFKRRASNSSKISPLTITRIHTHTRSGRVSAYASRRRPSRHAQRRTGPSKKSTAYLPSLPSNARTTQARLLKRETSGRVRGQREPRMMLSVSASWPWKPPCWDVQRRHSDLCLCRIPPSPHLVRRRRCGNASCRTALDAPLLIVAPARCSHPYLEKAQVVAV